MTLCERPSPAVQSSSSRRVQSRRVAHAKAQSGSYYDAAATLWPPTSLLVQGTVNYLQPSVSITLLQPSPLSAPCPGPASTLPNIPAQLFSMRHNAHCHIEAAGKCWQLATQTQYLPAAALPAANGLRLPSVDIHPVLYPYLHPPHIFHLPSHLFCNNPNATIHHPPSPHTILASNPECLGTVASNFVAPQLVHCMMSASSPVASPHSTTLHNRNRQRPLLSYTTSSPIITSSGIVFSNHHRPPTTFTMHVAPESHINNASLQF